MCVSTNRCLETLPQVPSVPREAKQQPALVSPAPSPHGPTCCPRSPTDAPPPVTHTLAPTPRHPLSGSVPGGEHSGFSVATLHCCRKTTLPTRDSRIRRSCAFIFTDSTRFQGDLGQHLPLPSGSLFRAHSTRVDHRGMFSILPGIPQPPKRLFIQVKPHSLCCKSLWVLEHSVTCPPLRCHTGSTGPPPLCSPVHPPLRTTDLSPVSTGLPGGLESFRVVFSDSRLASFTSTRDVSSALFPRLSHAPTSGGSQLMYALACCRAPWMRPDFKQSWIKLL